MVPTILLAALLGGGPQVVLAEEPLHQTLVVTLEPETGRLEAEARLAWSAPPGDVELALHADLEPRVDGAVLEPAGRVQGAVALERYRLTLPEGVRVAALRYGGAIRHPLPPDPTGSGRIPRMTPGLIGTEGVYLDGRSGWYPLTTAPRVRFDLTVRLPPGWDAVSQGRRGAADPGAVRWVEDTPQEEVYLVAGPWHRYERREDGRPEALAYLRRPDAELADRYLEATSRYLDLYGRLVGPYPYAKFALVENFWESGYGMPSFTLLGSRVIRLPFILESSYPHEILHNWWGNGVLVDYASGNWSEGLTAYLSDHLLQEQRGRGADYRRATLQKYADYVAEGRDFPLREFRGRHGEVSQAVGYGKTLMLVHMLRLRMGDDAFLEGLRRFYRDHLHRVAGFDDLRRAFEEASGLDLSGWFGRWLDRPGAPRLSVGDVGVFPEGDGYVVTGVLRQTQDEGPYPLDVPLTLDLEGRQDAQLHTVATTDREAAFRVEVDARPLRLRVDPQFDLFRRLDPSELPPSVGRALGDERSLFVLPAKAPPGQRAAWEDLARRWGASGPGRVALDQDMAALPDDRAVWLLGWDNRFLAELDRGRPEGGEAKVVLPDGAFRRGAHALVVIGERGRGSTIGWVAADTPETIGVLARKVPHYGRYGYLAFGSSEGENLAKGEWPGGDSVLSVPLPGAPPTPLRLPPRPPLSAAVAGPPARLAP